MNLSLAYGGYCMKFNDYNKASGMAKDQCLVELQRLAEVAECLYNGGLKEGDKDTEKYRIKKDALSIAFRIIKDMEE